jgi:hypothetical protein
VGDAAARLEENDKYYQVVNKLFLNGKPRC